MTRNKTIFAVLLISAFANRGAMADEARPEYKPVFDLSLNAALVSDYRYRGVSQTRLKPALQGGADIVHNPSGLYAGVWSSTITWTKDAGGGGNVELDLYGGKRGELAKEVGYDVGVLRYAYAANGLANVAGFVSANTTELYGQLSYGPVLIKYSQAVSNLFGFVDSKRSGYLDLSANCKAGQEYVVNLHVGHQRVANSVSASYSDWKVGVSRDFGLLTGAVAVIGTNADKVAYRSPANGKYLGKSALTLTLTSIF